MASPGLESFCCINYLNSSRTNQNNTFLHRTHLTWPDTTQYFIISLVSSSLSICGALFIVLPILKKYLLYRYMGTGGSSEISTEYQLSFRDEQSYRRRTLITTSLCVADLAACAGVFIRSVVWLTSRCDIMYITSENNIDTARYFCAISDVWIQYFYTTTYFWTFCFAYDSVLQVQKIPGKPIVYNTVSWIMPLVLTFCGAAPVYIPSGLHCERKFSHLFPNYLTTNVPLFIVMASNPILYYMAFKGARRLLETSGSFTDRERHVLEFIKRRFILFIGVFTICWITNVANACLLVKAREIPFSTFLPIWEVMAFTNPFQAFLNALVYIGVKHMTCCSNSQRFQPKPMACTSIIEQPYDVYSEREPLLKERTPHIDR